MQKLGTRDTYTPTNASQVRGNCDSVIKHGQSVQVLQSLKTVSNDSDVNRLSGKKGQDLRVPVLNMRGEALMPTTPGKARRLLKEDKASVVKRKPFTIQLKYATGETKQPITLGIDAGYQYIGFSAVSEKEELISGEVKLRTDIPKKMEQRKNYRRGRRSRLWYREPRFDNRKKDKSWLAPSIKHKLDSHVRLVNQLNEILPISNVVVEVASFDIQKIKNPDIEGGEYQEGETKDFWNVREYVLHRDDHDCQHCHGKKKDKILEVHHINSKKDGATDRPEELMTVCKTCHEEHHEGKDVIRPKKIKQFKPETFMTVVRWKIVDKLREIFGKDNVSHTYGYITKSDRIGSGMDKSHANDAFVIAGGTNQERCKSHTVKQVGRNNRSIQTNRKGYKPSIRKQRYNLQPNDLVEYDGKQHRVKGTHCYGSRVVLDDKKSVAISKTELIKYGKGLCYV